MVLNNPLDTELLRLRITLCGMIAALLFLSGALWRIQVLQAGEHSARLDRQSIRRVRVPGLRGRITDRNGRVLAGNRPSYCLAIYIEELRRPGRWEATVDEVDRTIRELARVLDMPVRVTRDDIRAHIRRRLPLPFLAWRDLDDGALARWAESGDQRAGVDIFIEPLREYPNGALAAHLLGYVGSTRGFDQSRREYDYYVPDMEGRDGVERVYDVKLAGEAGGRLIRVDASGYKHKEMAEREPVSGADLRLTLDANLQCRAETELAQHVGAIVAIDPRNGDVLALASAPAFDLNRIRDPAAFRRISGDPDKPLFNRAVSGAYPPGSTFKLMVALAALETGTIGPEQHVDCPGYFEIGDVRFRCWRRSGHGPLDLRRAIEQSCNTYFINVGLRIGYPRLVRMADAAGFGRVTGIDLPHEHAGLLPDDAWKRRTLRDGWRSGDTCNVSIGQGALLTTPLQMAVFTAALANGGTVYHPRLVMEAWDEGNIARELAWSPAALALIRAGMEDVVESPSGTGRRARIEGIATAGKTGTAEYGPRDDRRKYAWAIAYAPAQAPRVALAVVIEDATSGGIDAAPRVARIMAAALGTVPSFPELPVEVAL